MVELFMKLNICLSSSYSATYHEFNVDNRFALVAKFSIFLLYIFIYCIN